MPGAIRFSEEKLLKNEGYKLLKKLGEGGYAEVFLGQFNPNNGEKGVKLACKIVNTKKADKDFVSKFFPRELEILSKLNHPHIIFIHSIFQRGTKYFIFMRFAEKGDLLEYTLHNGPIPENQVRKWTKQLALAIQYLHIMEIVHRDLKCENVLITEQMNVKIADFGFARFIMDKNRMRESSQTFCGSLSYAPPEILKGEPYNPKIADIWSFGVIIYTMLNQGHPFPETDIDTMLKNQISRNWKFRTKLVKIISEEVKTLITFMIEPDVWKRYTIDHVVSSSFISMDPKLTKLTPVELAAFERAMDEARGRHKTDVDKKRGSYIFDQKQINPAVMGKNLYKKYENGFDLNTIRSDLVMEGSQFFN